MKKHKISVCLLLLTSLWFLVACGSGEDVGVEGVEAEITTVAFNQESDCLDSFVTGELDHITSNAYEPVVEYDSNGAGIAKSFMAMPIWPEKTRSFGMRETSISEKRPFLMVVPVPPQLSM